MSNSFFQFKQFIVDQSEAALKVCTESCIFGAYIPIVGATHILDIGTGTGLLSLMLAQRSSASIEAVELDEPSCNDAEKNFLQSPWKDRLHLHRADVHSLSSEKKFDLIVSNPPFFIDHLKSPHERTNAALHGSELKPEDLSRLVNTLGTDNGYFFVLLPEKELMALTKKMTATGWQLIQRLTIYQQEGKPVFRMIGGFQRTSSNKEILEQSLIIYNTDRSYTKDFVDLLQAYYLYL